MTSEICLIPTDDKGRELQEHGTAAFPVACYEDNLVTEPASWHWHDELELAIITEGTARVTAGNQKYTVTHGNGFFINSSVLHDAWHVDCSACRFHSIVFHPRFVGGSLDSIFWQKYIEPLITNQMFSGIMFDSSVDWQKEALITIESAWQSGISAKPAYEFKLRTDLSHLIYLLYSHMPAAPGEISTKKLRDGERIKTMLQYIHIHFPEEITVAQIAQSAIISESECLRCFRKNIGTSPIQYVKQYRIQKAAELLTGTEYKIAEIGNLCGFQDISYFIKTFREMKTMTPSEFRKKSF